MSLTSWKVQYKNSRQQKKISVFWEQNAVLLHYFSSFQLSHGQHKTIRIEALKESTPKILCTSCCAWASVRQIALRIEALCSVRAKWLKSIACCFLYGSVKGHVPLKYLMVRSFLLPLYSFIFAMMSNIKD